MLKNKVKGPGLHALLCQGSWGWRFCKMVARGWPLWVMRQRSHVHINYAKSSGSMCGSQPQAKRAGQRDAAYMWPNVVVVESDAASQALKIRAKKQKERKGGNGRQRREVMREGERAAEWLNYFFHFCFTVCSGEMRNPAAAARRNSLLTMMKAAVLVFFITACWCMGTSTPKGLMCRGLCGSFI